MTVRKLVIPLVLAGGVALLACAPYLAVPGLGVLPDTVGSIGSLQVLGTAYVIAALAITYDLLMGYTGLVSFGHGMFFALGSYGFVMLLAFTSAGFWTAAAVAVGITVVAAVIVNAVALRASLIAYSMVTLAAAQLMAIAIGQNYLGSGGVDGVTIPFEKLPAGLVGIVNTKHVYWLALGLLVLTFVLARWLTTTRIGHVWRAIRENELRAEVMGFTTYTYKLVVALIASTLAGVAGVVYAILLGAADPGETSLSFSIGLVIMLILGGRGRVWGALLGAVVYTLLQQRLPAITSSAGVAALPDAIRIPLAQPQLLLGVVFILFVLFLPGGLAGVVEKAIRAVRRGGSGPPGDAAADGEFAAAVRVPASAEPTR
ncbi:branched-chain amino acid ABC transporter permease [Planotetraspora silvatica]|uniref:Branched-chain amino acid ABC transporter permease n=1 Tax=Planotetraspora silvatica TaxID=234614 RepID=A0A8J3V594_9ACTN|nr:branched-chain amino acid ABC transporter permease [Planotetraspora silvatica]